MSARSFTVCEVPARLPFRPGRRGNYVAVVRVGEEHRLPIDCFNGMTVRANSAARARQLYRARRKRRRR